MQYKRLLRKVILILGLFIEYVIRVQRETKSPQTSSRQKTPLIPFINALRTRMMRTVVRRNNAEIFLFVGKKLSQSAE